MANGFRIEKRRKGVCNPLIVAENSREKRRRVVGNSAAA